MNWDSISPKAFLSDYGTEVLALLKDELRLSHAMQRLVNWKWLLNTVIRKAGRSEEIADAISCMFDDLEEREKLISPSLLHESAVRLSRAHYIRSSIPIHPHPIPA